MHSHKDQHSESDVSPHVEAIIPPCNSPVFPVTVSGGPGGCERGRVQLLVSTDDVCAALRIRRYY
jgi:hypothetical protein